MSIKTSGRNATRNQNAYLKNKFDKTLVLTPKEGKLKERIKAAAAGCDESLNQFIVTSVIERLERLQGTQSDKTSDRA